MYTDMRKITNLWTNASNTLEFASAVHNAMTKTPCETSMVTIMIMNRIPILFVEEVGNGSRDVAVFGS
jgi:hypothetical protein